MAGGRLAGKQIVFLSSIDWGAAWQRHHAWASRFAAAGHDVFFVENTGFRDFRLSDAKRAFGRLTGLRHAGPPIAGIRVVSPLMLPPTKSAFRALNRSRLIPRLVERLRASGLQGSPAVFAYLPTATTLELLDRLAPSLVVYDCVDNFAGHPAPPRDLAETEEALLRRADCVLVTSPYLLEKHSAGHRNVHELHHGVDERFFAVPSRVAVEYRRFCYFGSLWHAIDYRPIRALAEAGFSVTLLGPLREPLPPLPPSVRWLPGVAADALPAALSEFDGLLLPYADTPYNRGVTPAKTYECLATGKPVLATPIGGLERFAGYFYLHGDPDAWPRVARELPRTESEARRQARLAEARRHSTDAQFRELLSLVEGC